MTSQEIVRVKNTLKNSGYSLGVTGKEWSTLAVRTEKELDSGEKVALYDAVSAILGRPVRVKEIEFKATGVIRKQVA